MKNKTQDRVIVFDTTLRDGEQSPGASLNIEEKRQAARALADLGVDVIEAGFPVSSPGDFEAVKTVAKDVRGPEVCGLARAIKGDIDACWNAVKHAKKPRIHTFIATSDLHIEQKLRMTRAQVLDRAVEMVRYAKKFTDNVEFSAEDAVRTDFDYLCQVVEAVIDAGARTVNIPDTVGYSIPSEWGDKIGRLIARVPNIRKAVVSVHCHNDLGLGVANSLAAIQHGARQVECTINGIGERAGNAALEEVVMALRTRSDVYKGLHTAINTKLLVPSSRKLALVTGLAVPRNKAIVGQNAFAHESGIHQDGVLKHRNTYEIMVPADVGLTDTELVLGKHSGRAALRQRVEALGYHFDDAQFQLLFEQFKALADRKKTVYDADVEALAEAMLHKGSTSAMWTLEAFTTNAGTGTIPMAAVCLWRSDGEIFKDAAMGDGPIDAIFKCIERIAGIEVKLRDYRVRSVTDGEDAQGEAQIECDYQGQTLRGRGVSTDIVEASAQAFLQVINRAAQKLGPARLNPYDVQPVAAAQEAAGS